MAGFLAVLALGGLFAMRPSGPDPMQRFAYRAELAARARSSQDALDVLAAGLSSALEEGRRGAAAAVSGSDPPGVHLEAAATKLEAARAPARRAAEALTDLSGALAIDGRLDRPRLMLSADDLGSIAAQLSDTETAADSFAEMRRSTRRVLDELQAALTSLQAADTTAAASEIDAAEAALASVRGWPGKLDTLPIWTSTVGRLLASLRDVVDARRSGDASREARARDAYRAAAADASRADRALAIALAEGGGGLSEAPLARLADAISKVQATRSAVASLVHPS